MFCVVVCLFDRELIFWVDRKAPVWAIQVSPVERKRLFHMRTNVIVCVWHVVIVLHFWV